MFEVLSVVTTDYATVIETNILGPIKKEDVSLRYTKQGVVSIIIKNELSAKGTFKKKSLRQIIQANNIVVAFRDPKTHKQASIYIKKSN